MSNKNTQKMKLFTKEIETKLQKQFPLGNDLDNQVVVCKIFNPYGKGTWYIINQDPEDTNYLWCIAVLDYVEVGSVSKADLEEKYFFGGKLGFERDLYFPERNAGELLKELLNKK